MNGKTRKVLNRMWRGRSHNKGGERIAVLREKSTAQTDRRENLS